jgi:hypothetical protein
MSDKLANALNITPIDKNFNPTSSPIRVENSDNVNKDFEYARGNLINIIEKGNEALDGILEVAQMSQHPRSFEVVAELIKTMADTNKDLLELSKRKKDLEELDIKSPQTINNNLFVGSTSELQKLIKQQNEQE